MKSCGGARGTCRCTQACTTGESCYSAHRVVNSNCFRTQDNRFTRQTLAQLAALLQVTVRFVVHFQVYAHREHTNCIRAQKLNLEVINGLRRESLIGH